QEIIRNWRKSKIKKQIQVANVLNIVLCEAVTDPQTDAVLMKCCCHPDKKDYSKNTSRTYR
ncbi:MAG: hypothetical protein QM594_00335, partial [Niabella sp.]